MQGRVDGEREAEARGQHRFRSHFQFFQLCLLQPFRLGPSVLEPDFDLGLCEVQGAGELGALCDGEVLFLAELALERQELRRGEGCARLPIGLVLAQGAGGGARVSWGAEGSALATASGFLARCVCRPPSSALKKIPVKTRCGISGSEGVRVDNDHI